MSSNSLTVSPSSSSSSLVDCFPSTESMGLSCTSNSVPGCSNSISVFNGEDDEDSSSHILCAWCQKIGTKVFSLRTTDGFKAFCSELCFAQCRRASFKKNKVCDWCKHVRHTVNYVDFQNGEQSLQFCSDKCLNQYKMNIFCRETQAHLNAFSAVYRSPSPPKSYQYLNIFRSSSDLSESEKDNSKEIEIPTLSSDLWLQSSTFHPIAATSTSSQSPSSLSSSPRQPSSPSPASSALESSCLPVSSSSSFPSKSSSLHYPPIELKCSKEISVPKPPKTDQPKVTSNQQQSIIFPRKVCAKLKIVSKSREKSHKSKSGSISKTSGGTKQRSSKINRKLSSNQENIRDLNTAKSEKSEKNERSNLDAGNCGSTTPSNHLESFPSRFSHIPSIGHSIEDKNLEPPVTNCSATFNNLPNEPMRISHFPHLPHPHPQYSPQHFFHPLRPDFLRFRQSLPMFPFNQQNLFRLPGHHRPSFQPIPVHHSPFSRPPHLPDHQSSQPPVPLQFQPPMGPIGQSMPNNNSFNYPVSSSMGHPFLLPLPMPLPLPIPFPIRFNSSSSHPLISTEDKEVQVGINQQQPFSQFNCNPQLNTETINDIETMINNNSESINQTRFRIDTLMHKLIDKRMRSIDEPNDQDDRMKNIHSECNAINLKRNQIESKSTESLINSDIDSRIDSPHLPCFLKAKRFKRDILSI